MRILCIILNIALACIAFRALLAATSFYRGYNTLHTFGVGMQQVNEWAMPYVILFAVNAVALGFSIFFFMKKKPYVTIAISAVVIIFYFVAPHLGYPWLK